MRKHIFVWVGKGGYRVYQYLSGYGLQNKIKYVIDNDESKHGSKFFGIEIIGRDKLRQIYDNYENAIVFIASGSAAIIKKQLIDMGFEEKEVISFVIANLSIKPTPYQFFVERKEKLKSVLALLADEQSRNCYISLINYKMTMDAKWLKDVFEDEAGQYFDPIMNLNDSESFVDCGAYIGDTLDNYYQKVGTWEKYYCFEADPNVCNNLKNHIDERGYSSCYIYNIGCWNENTEINFEPDSAGTGAIKKNNIGIKVKADSLDHVLKDKKVTVIKMDIEGAEQNAIEGAKGIITSQHPKLAICIYHSMEDFIEIPLKLHMMNSNYKIYIRHYREMADSENVCYAI